MLSSEELRATRAESPLRDEQKQGCSIVLSPQQQACGSRVVVVFYYTAFSLVIAAFFFSGQPTMLFPAFFLATRSWFKRGVGERKERKVN